MLLVQAQVAGLDVEGEHGEVRTFGFAQVAFSVAAVFGGGLVVAACGGEQARHGAIGGDGGVFGDADQRLQRVDGAAVGGGICRAEQGAHVFGEFTDQVAFGGFKGGGVASGGAAEGPCH